MDKETAERLTRLETVSERNEKERDSWNQLLKRVIVQFTIWLSSLALGGIMFGWKLPANIRAAIADYYSK